MSSSKIDMEDRDNLNSPPPQSSLEAPRSPINTRSTGPETVDKKIGEPHPNELHIKLQLQILRVIYILLNAFLFGFLLEKAKVFSPEVIQGQMTLHNWRMMKFFLAFVGVSQIILGLFALPSREGRAWHHRFSNRIHKMRERRVAPGSTGPYKQFRGPIPVLMGSSVLGVGMAFAGACPGTVYVQAGAGLISGGWVLLGGVFGALVFALLQSAFMNTVTWTLGQKFFVKHYGLGDRIYSALAIPFGFIFCGMSVMLHFIATSDNGFDYVFGTGVRTISSNILLWQTWNPVICGAIAGVLIFFPNVLLMNMTVGYSMTFPALIAPFLSFPALNETIFFESPHDIKDMEFPSFIWVRKLSPAIGAFLGALTSSLFSRQFSRYMDFSNVPAADDKLILWYDSEAVRIVQPVVGGFLIVLGARIAGGCTSGHGITGITLLRSPSVLIAVPAMFFGGILTGVTMKLAITGKMF